MHHDLSPARGEGLHPAAPPGPATPTAQPWPLAAPGPSYQVRVLESDVAPGHHLTVAVSPGQRLLGALRPLRAAGQ